MHEQSLEFDILQGRFTLAKKKAPEQKFKAEYSTLFPTKMSSSNFIQLYTLYLLSKREFMYGKQILNELKSVVDKEVWKPSHGTLYPLLKILEKDDFIQVHDIEDITPDAEEVDKRIKKYYSITNEGRKELNHRLDEFKDKLIGSKSFFSTIVKRLYDSNK